ncbi:putative B-cell receptor-associated protein 29/31 [Senna tora]|uniref:Endoplasmic reticulum transmembrane protein n=1 Tax=Senna tora TaxID=362788 RepID=A0A834U202_9FABA|nr:putative B-cell receptor-associated protein 29/31 [Senna tora]
MIQVLSALVVAEMAFVVTLSFASPIRRAAVKGLDLLKQGKGPLVTKTVAATLLVVFGSTIYTLTNLQKRVRDTGIVNATDEVLMLQRFLEASLMGFSLFLGLVIDRLHYYIREINIQRKAMEMAKVLNQNHEPPRSRRTEETNKTKVK